MATWMHMEATLTLGYPSQCKECMWVLHTLPPFYVIFNPLHQNMHAVTSKEFHCKALQQLTSGPCFNKSSAVRYCLLWEVTLWPESFSPESILAVTPQST